MADLMDRLGSARFDGIKFPLVAGELRGAYRKHVHTYPHVDAGYAEKLGRELYQVTVHAIFDTSLERYPQYESNYPTALNQLLRKWEQGTTGALYLPTRGTLLCFADGWTVQMTAQVRSGERVDVTFIEDDPFGFTLNDFLVTGIDLGSKQSTLAELRKKFGADLAEPDKSLFDRIDDAVNVVRAALDQIELGQSLALAKVERLTNLCNEADDRLRAFQSPLSYPMVEALRELWAASVSLGQTASGQSKKSPVRTFDVPIQMSVQQVAAAIYGDALRSPSLLDLNYFPDAFAIPRGTQVRYYPDAP